VSGGVSTAPPSQARRVTVSATSQLVGRAVHLVLNVVSTLAILRYLAPEAYGSFVLVVTVVTMAGVVADFGLPKLAVRELARSEGDQDEVLGTVVLLRLGLALAAVVGTQAVLAVLGVAPVVHQAAAVASLAVLVDAVLGIVVVCFQVHVVHQYEAVVRVGAEALETGLVLLLISLQAGFLWLFAPPVVGLLAGLVLAVVFARRRFALRLRPVRRRLRYLVLEALPLGPALLIGVLYLKVDTLVLAALRPPRDVGIYGSAYQPVEYLFLATAVIINVLFPLLARAVARGDQQQFVTIYRRGTELLVIMTLFVPLVFAFTAPAVVQLLFGPAYADAASPLRILAAALVTMTVSGWQSLVLLAGGRQRITLLYNSGALVLAAGLCFWLVRELGLIGAAISALATSLVVLVASVAAVWRCLGATLDPRPLARVLLAAGGTALVLAALHAVSTPWVLLVLAAVVLYAAALRSFGFHRSIREAFA
jgi:O-antigen/teichoic acid export membrane protein